MSEEKRWQMTKADELIRLLFMSSNYTDSNDGRDHITGLVHAQRVSSLAFRHDPHSEMVFVGLVHDLARPLSDIYHGEVIAEVVRDIVSDASYHALRTHGEYQSAYLHGSQIDVHPEWRKQATSLCAWEIASFDKDWRLPIFSWEESVEIIRTKCANSS